MQNNAESLKENWTKDENGEYVNWLDDAYTKNTFPGNLILVLPGETWYQMTAKLRQKRIAEYYALVKRQTNTAREKLANIVASL